MRPLIDKSSVVYRSLLTAEQSKDIENLEATGGPTEESWKTVKIKLSD